MNLTSELSMTRSIGIFSMNAPAMAKWRTAGRIDGVADVCLRLADLCCLLAASRWAGGETMR